MEKLFISWVVSIRQKIFCFSDDNFTLKEQMRKLACGQAGIMFWILKEFFRMNLRS